MVSEAYVGKNLVLKKSEPWSIDQYKQQAEERFYVLHQETDAGRPSCFLSVKQNHSPQWIPQTSKEQ